MVLNASFLSLHANSGLFWVPMPKTARQEVLGWDGARAAGWAEGGGIWLGKGAGTWELFADFRHTGPDKWELFAYFRQLGGGVGLVG